MTAAASNVPLSTSPSSNGHRSYADAAKQRSNSNPPSAPEDIRSANVCVKLCSLIKGQLLNALQEVTSRFGGQVTLSQARQEGNLTDSPVTPPPRSFEDVANEEAAGGVYNQAQGGGDEHRAEAPLATCETELVSEQEVSLPNGHAEKPKASGEGIENENACFLFYSYHVNKKHVLGLLNFFKEPNN